MKFWPHWLCERDNKTPCPIRIWWFIVFAHMLGVSAWSAYRGINFNFGEMTHAWVEFLGAASLAIAGKALTESKPGMGAGNA